jgi:glycosyltransferase involved in cell wall biosynthesis
MISDDRPPRRQRRIVAFAYACEPDRGSEPAAGWRWAQMLARLGETWIITRSNNRAIIERELETTGRIPDLHFVYVDLPASLRRWKRGQRGVRLYYLLWQRLALQEARKLACQQPFDLAWHLTFANAWIGSAISRLGIPFVYGPIGGGVRTPWRLTTTLGVRGIVYETTRLCAQALGRYMNPLARTSWRRATLILVQNEETRQWLPRRYRSRAQVFPHAVLEELAAESDRDRQRLILFAGRLLPWKGGSIAISALERLPDWRLVICGDGPDFDRLQQRATKCGLLDRVDFRGWVAHDEVLRTMREEASILAFPSLHDDSPFVVAEAIASGLPVVCLNVGGPPVIAGDRFAVAPADPIETAQRIADLVVEAAGVDQEWIRDRAREFLIDQRLIHLQVVLQARIPHLFSSCDRCQSPQTEGISLREKSRTASS